MTAGGDVLEPGPGGPGTSELTATEWQVVGLLAQSLAVEEVARRLGVAAEAVLLRRSSALAKLGRSKRIEAVELRRALEERRDAGSG